MKGRVALTDDHVLIRKGIAGMLQKMDYDVLFESSNGQEMIENLSRFQPPDVMLMDINMPVMDGYKATEWLKKNHPGIKVLVLSMLDDESNIIRMIRAGAKGYILKDSQPMELDFALRSLIDRGFYQSELLTSKLMTGLSEKDLAMPFDLTRRETEFLALVCTEMTYREIADQLKVSPRTVDGYRDGLFEKLGVHTRIGLVIFAIRQGFYQV